MGVFAYHDTIIYTGVVYMDKKYCDAVFEGGGIRGIGHIGAIQEFEKTGYTFRNVAGTSVGAMIAALIAAGYSPREMYAELGNMDFKNFKKFTMFTAGSLGIYSAEKFEEWFDELLSRKNVSTFADVGPRLKIVAADLTTKKTLVLPDGLSKFGIDPKTFKISTAVRMSMSIPIFYEPFILRDKEGNVHYIVDGGLLSNFPIWLFDDGSKKQTVPVFGFRFKKHNTTPEKIPHVISYIKELVAASIEGSAHSVSNLLHGDAERTVYIDTMVNDVSIGVTDFSITKQQQAALYNNGVAAAKSFLPFNFKDWQKNFRSDDSPKTIDLLKRFLVKSGHEQINRSKLEDE